MKKIMFNDKYGLTKAVLDGKKTMTRRVAYDKPMRYMPHVGMEDGYLILCDGWQKVAKSAYRVGEEIAIAQRYNDIVWHTNPNAPQILLSYEVEKLQHTAGWTNKMFVKADWMPHRIRITNVKVEQLLDISDEDCRKEGIIHVEWKQWLEQDLDDLSPQKYKMHDLWTLPMFEEELLDAFADQSRDNITATDPHTCFTVLFAKLAKKQPTDMMQLNPWVFAYEFKLIV